MNFSQPSLNIVNHNETHYSWNVKTRIRFKAAEMKFMSRTAGRALLESKTKDISVELGTDRSKRNYCTRNQRCHIMELAVFWEVTKRSLINSYYRFGGTFIRNVDEYLPDYTAQHTRIFILNAVRTVYLISWDSAWRMRDIIHPA
jgi:hypothetical protein